jgi:hypothetical protein
LMGGGQGEGDDVNLFNSFDIVILFPTRLFPLFWFKESIFKVLQQILRSSSFRWSSMFYSVEDILSFFKDIQV